MAAGRTIVGPPNDFVCTRPGTQCVCERFAQLASAGNVDLRHVSLADRLLVGRSRLGELAVLLGIRRRRQHVRHRGLQLG